MAVERPGGRGLPPARGRDRYLHEGSACEVSMRLHHLNCISTCPLGGAVMDAQTKHSLRGRLACHCILVETADELVLVDTGFGLRDVESPRTRLSRFFLMLVRPELREEMTAISVHWRYRTVGSTLSTRCAAILAARRAQHDGHTPRRLHENATSNSSPHPTHRTREPPCASTPQDRYALNSCSTNAGSPPLDALCRQKSSSAPRTASWSALCSG